MNELPEVDVDALIQETLTRAGRGLSAQKIHASLPKASRPSRAAVFDRLRVMARTGTVHPWPGGKTPLFGFRGYEDELRSRVVSAVADAPRTEAELRRGVPRAGHPLLRRAIDTLVAEGRIHRHPKRGRRQDYAATPADPLPYLRPLYEKAIDALIQKVVKLGFSEPEARAGIGRLAPTAAAPQEPAEALRHTILELNPRAADGALVYIPHVRVAIGSAVEHDVFDRTLLALLSQERVQLQAHPVPSQLTTEEKRAMVPDGRGSYYMAVGLR